MPTVDYTEEDGAIPLEGIIAVQVHAGAPMEARYRNLRRYAVSGIVAAYSFNERSRVAIAWHNRSSVVRQLGHCPVASIKTEPRCVHAMMS